MRGKCLTVLRTYITQRILKAKRISAKAKAEKGSTSPRESTDETGGMDILEYRAVASTLKPAIQLVEFQSTSSSEYANLLNNLQQFLMNTRQQYLRDSVDKTVQNYASTLSLPDLVEYYPHAMYPLL